MSEKDYMASSPIFDIIGVCIRFTCRKVSYNILYKGASGVPITLNLGLVFTSTRHFTKEQAVLLKNERIII